MAPGLPGASREESAFAADVAGRLAELPGVTAVSLGGSRAVGTQLPDSDWDFADHALAAAGAAARAAAETAHGVLAARGEWVVNEKRLLDRAGLRHLDAHAHDFDRVDAALREAMLG